MEAENNSTEMASDGSQEASGETTVNVKVSTNGSTSVTLNESWFDTLVRDLNATGSKGLDKSKIEQCFDYFKSKPESSDNNQGTVEGLTFDDFTRLLNELFVDHSTDVVSIKNPDKHSCDESIPVEDESTKNVVDENLAETANGAQTMIGPSVEVFKSFYIPKSYYIELFQKFDRNRDNIIDRREFNAMWGKWIQIILKPKTAFIIVDVQNDFINGSLAIFRCPAGLFPSFHSEVNAMNLKSIHVMIRLEKVGNSDRFFNHSHISHFIFLSYPSLSLSPFSYFLNRF